MRDKDFAVNLFVGRLLGRQGDIVDFVKAEVVRLTAERDDLKKQLRSLKSQLRRATK